MLLFNRMNFDMVWVAGILSKPFDIIPHTEKLSFGLSVLVIRSTCCIYFTWQTGGVVLFVLTVFVTFFYE